jgi:predicted nucleic acid-binding Zn ribbon protein
MDDLEVLREMVRRASEFQREANAMGFGDPTKKYCVRCGKPVEPGRKKYCGDACADSASRSRLKLRKAQVGSLSKGRWVRHTPGS